MSSTTVIVVEGVLRQNVGDGVIRQGQHLYHGLKETSKIALVSNHLDTENVERWLSLNGFTDHPYFFGAQVDDPWGAAGTRMRQLTRLREGGNFVELVIEPNPEITASLMAEGVSTLTFLHPKYTRPEFRPDHSGEPVPWDSLVAEVERQESLRALDKRAHDE